MPAYLNLSFVSTTRTIAGETVQLVDHQLASILKVLSSNPIVSYFPLLSNKNLQMFCFAYHWWMAFWNYHFWIWLAIFFTSPKLFKPQAAQLSILRGKISSTAPSWESWVKDPLPRGKKEKKPSSLKEFKPMTFWLQGVGSTAVLQQLPISQARLISI